MFALDFETCSRCALLVFPGESFNDGKCSICNPQVESLTPEYV